MIFLAPENLKAMNGSGATMHHSSVEPDLIKTEDNKALLADITMSGGSESVNAPYRIGESRGQSSGLSIDPGKKTVTLACGDGQWYEDLVGKEMMDSARAGRLQFRILGWRSLELPEVWTKSCRPRARRRSTM